MARKDYKVSNESTFDLLIQNGDFRVEDATRTHAKILIKANKGEIRQYPLLGIAIERYIGSNVDTLIIEDAIREGLRQEGIRIKSLSLVRTLSNIDVELEVQ